MDRSLDRGNPSSKVRHYPSRKAPHRLLCIVPLYRIEIHLQRSNLKATNLVVIIFDLLNDHPRRTDPRRAFLALGGADVVAEFVGAPHAVDEGVRLLRQAGRYFWVGNITPGPQSSLDPGTVVRGGQTIRGVTVYEPWVLPRAIDWLARRKDAYPFDKIISHTFPFAEINQAFPFANDGKAIRVSLEM